MTDAPTAKTIGRMASKIDGMAVESSAMVVNTSTTAAHTTAQATASTVISSVTGNSLVLSVGGDRIFKFLQVAYTTTASAPVRQIVMDIRTANASVVFESKARAVQGASLTTVYTFGPGLASDAAAVNGTQHTGVPAEMFIPNGWTVRVRDENNVTVTELDTFNARLQVTGA